MNDPTQGALVDKYGIGVGMDIHLLEQPFANSTTVGGDIAYGSVRLVEADEVRRVGLIMARNLLKDQAVRDSIGLTAAATTVGGMSARV